MSFVLVGDAEGDRLKGKSCEPLPAWVFKVFHAGLNALRSAVKCADHTSLTLVLTAKLTCCLMLVTVLRIYKCAQVTMTIVERQWC